MSKGEGNCLKTKLLDCQAERLTFGADKRGFKLRHRINVSPTTCDSQPNDKAEEKQIDKKKQRKFEKN